MGDLSIRAPTLSRIFRTPTRRGLFPHSMLTTSKWGLLSNKCTGLRRQDTRAIDVLWPQISHQTRTMDPKDSTPCPPQKRRSYEEARPRATEIEVLLRAGVPSSDTNVVILANSCGMYDNGEERKHYASFGFVNWASLRREFRISF